ncbi:MAG: sn-glycerol-1-phosphate dehydrogenase [Bacillota bacterium]|nr:sn-glycerol-1-phosphate dehydrogenase [Bacillota bacterium]
MLFENLINNEMACKCGVNHSISIKEIIIGKGAINKLEMVISKLGFTDNFHIVADANTYKVAANQVERKFLERSYNFTSTVFEKKDLIADESALTRLLNEIDDETSCIIAVGSGTINDLSRYAAFKLNKPYLIIATAPSMDGYASSVSPLIINGFKRTYSAIAPIAIIGDTDILKNAPYEMITAGFGDMLGKYISLSDWKLGYYICNEYYCEAIVSIVEKALKLCIDQIEGLKRREDDAIENLMNGLVLSGLAMLMAGNSRPASGSEHHLAHFWEMRFISEGKKQILHGHKVGVASVLMAKRYNFLSMLDKIDVINYLSQATTVSEDDTKARIKEVYGSIANEVIQENAYMDYVKEINRKIVEEWASIKEIADKAPLSNVLKSILEAVEAPSSPEDINISGLLVDEGSKNCMYARNRYTVLRLFDQLGLIDFEC